MGGGCGLLTHRNVSTSQLDETRLPESQVSGWHPSILVCLGLGPAIRYCSCGIDQLVTVSYSPEVSNLATDRSSLDSLAGNKGQLITARLPFGGSLTGNKGQLITARLPFGGSNW
jgi:hypothetical protein